MTEWHDPISFQARLDRELEEIRAMLLAKNRAYGDSALNPVRVFSQASSAEQIRVRIDDKISRLVRGQNAGEDTATDLIGYLILLRMAETRDRDRARADYSEPAARAGSARAPQGGGSQSLPVVPSSIRPEGQSAQAGAAASRGHQHDDAPLLERDVATCVAEQS